MSVKPDRIWSLPEDHEIVTKQTWAMLLKQWGYDLDNLSFSDIEKKANFVASKAPMALPTVEKESVLAQCPPVTERTKKVYDALNGKADVFRGEMDDLVKLPQKDTHQHLAKYSSAQLHQAFLGSLRQDSPDNELLRFVRARKFKLLPIVDMLALCMHWKAESHPVNKWLMGGDLALYFSQKYPELIKAFEMDKVYLRGRDKKGGLICVIRVKKHFGSDCPEKDFEILICLIIEWSKLALASYNQDIDGANILFDMSGFSLKNADLNAVKFLAKAFEANYPESLTAIWIHKAPWIFNAVWKIIKGWLDPVVASKIHFTKSVSDLEKFVDKKHVPSDLGGDDDYKFKYITPTKENSSVLPADDKFKQLTAEREALLLAFMEATIAWINAKTKEDSTKMLNMKIQLGGQLAKNFISLDPYVRQRGAFDRNNDLGEMTY